MPHLYSDRRAENEEIQKLLHVAMLKLLIARLCNGAGEPNPASWEAVQAKAQEIENEHTVLHYVRRQAMNEVAQARNDLKNAPVFGQRTEERRQFEVQVVATKRPGRAITLEFAKRSKKALLQKALHEVNPQASENEQEDRAGGDQRLNVQNAEKWSENPTNESSKSED